MCVCVLCVCERPTAPNGIKAVPLTVVRPRKQPFITLHPASRQRPVLPPRLTSPTVCLRSRSRPERANLDPACDAAASGRVFQQIRAVSVLRVGKKRRPLSALGFLSPGNFLSRGTMSSDSAKRRNYGHIKEPRVPHSHREKSKFGKFGLLSRRVGLNCFLSFEKLLILQRRGSRTCCFFKKKFDTV